MVGSLRDGAGLVPVVQVVLVPHDEPAVRRLDDAVAAYRPHCRHRRAPQARPEATSGPVPLPAGFASLPPGPALGAVLAEVPVRRVSGHDTVDVMAAAYRQACHAQSVFLRALLETGMRRAHSGDGVARVESPGEFAAEEARAALVWSRRRADSTFEFAWQVHERLPMLGEAMDAGVLDEPRARAFVQWTIGLSDDQAAQVIAGVLPVAAGLLVGALIDRIKRAAIAIDPGWAERRYRAAVKGRRVEGSRNDDGTANVQGLDLPVDRAAAACDRIDTLARACKHAGDGRPIDHVRADLYLGMLDGTFEQLADDQIVDHVLRHPFADLTQPDPGPGPASHAGHGDADDAGSGGEGGPAVAVVAVDGAAPGGTAPGGTALGATASAGSGQGRWCVRELRVEVATALGLNEHPAEIVGWDFIPATLARPLLASMTGAQWRWVVCDRHGRPIDSGITRRRPAPPSSPGPEPPAPEPPGREPAPSAGRGSPAIVELQVKADELAELIAAGRGLGWDPVLADVARQHAANTAGANTAGTGDATAGSADPGVHQHRRSARAGLRRSIQIRDRCCTHPACRAPASRTDQDHAIDHAHGGATDQANLGCCCRHDHRLKHDGGWRLHKPAPDVTVWTSPLGRTYTNRPPPIMPSLPTPSPSPESKRAATPDTPEIPPF